MQTAKAVFPPQLMLPPSMRSRPTLLHQAEGEPQAPRPPELTGAACQVVLPVQFLRPCAINNRINWPHGVQAKKVICVASQSPCLGPAIRLYYSPGGVTRLEARDILSALAEPLSTKVVRRPRARGANYSTLWLRLHLRLRLRTRTYPSGPATARRIPRRPNPEARGDLLPLWSGCDAPPAP